MINLKINYDVVFISGVIEFNNFVLKGIVYCKFDIVKEIIIFVLEYLFVLEVVRYLEVYEGFKVKYVDVKKDGSINLEYFKELMLDKVGLVICMYVNNVIG